MKTRSTRSASQRGFRVGQVRSVVQLPLRAWDNYKNQAEETRATIAAVAEREGWTELAADLSAFAEAVLFLTAFLTSGVVEFAEA